MFQDDFWNCFVSPDGVKLVPMVGYILKVLPVSDDPTMAIEMIHMDPKAGIIKPYVPVGFTSEAGLMIRCSQDDTPVAEAVPAAEAVPVAEVAPAAEDAPVANGTPTPNGTTTAGVWAGRLRPRG